MALPIPTSPLTYNAYVAALGVLAVVDVSAVNGVNQTSDAGLNALLPSILNYSELRIQRDTDLAALVSSGTGYSVTAASNVLSLPTTDWVTVQTLLINGTPLSPVSKAWIQNVYGSNANPGQPTVFAPYGGDQATAGQTSMNYLVGPWPDATYPVAVTGTQRMPSLALQATQANAGSGTTFVSTWLPDLLLVASMLMVSGRQRDFSPMGSDPQAPVSWESQYQALLTGARVEEARKKFEAGGWSSMSPPAVATPVR